MDRPAQVVCRAVVAAEGEGVVGAGETCLGAGEREEAFSLQYYMHQVISIFVSLEKGHMFYNPHSQIN